ncbi:MAG: SpoIIE family protein phosphatase, partial [Duodenibacillus sp.]|nr:SpoIIE family protein phosphatase [Duodenibacillus sp.]
MMILQTALTAVCPALAFLLLERVRRSARFASLPAPWRRALLGLCSGALAVAAGQLAVVTADGYNLQVQSACVIGSVLIFGAPAGLAAGAIAAAGNLLWACLSGGYHLLFSFQLAPLAAAGLAALFRKRLCGGAAPGPVPATLFALWAVAAQVIAAFIENADLLGDVYGYFRHQATLFAAVNVAALSLAVIAVALDRKQPLASANRRSLAGLFNAQLGFALFIAFALSLGSVYYLEDAVMVKATADRLVSTTADVRNSFGEVYSAALVEKARIARKTLESEPVLTNALLREIADDIGVDQLHVISPDGKITYSAERIYVGFDLNSTEQSREFMDFYSGGADTHAQEARAMGFDNKSTVKFAAARMDKGFLQVGQSLERMRADLNENIPLVAENRNVNNAGRVVVVDGDGFVVRGGMHSGNGRPLGDFSPELLAVLGGGAVPEGKLFACGYQGVPHYMAYGRYRNYYSVAMEPVAKALMGRDVSLMAFLLTEVFVFGVLLGSIVLLLRFLVIDELDGINASLRRITGGDLGARTRGRRSEEFVFLSDSINLTVDALQEYTRKATESIEKELEIARTIQASSMPEESALAAFAGRIALKAGMVTAKEVGGDFYDFYPLSDGRVALLIADVSGKGISAAMFMMRAKATLRHHVRRGRDLAQAIARVNDDLCAGNEVGMFVTCWIGVLDLGDNTLVYCNAGHNHPAVKKPDGSVRWVEGDSGLVLGGIDGMPYTPHSLRLEKGDMLYLY